MNDEQLISPSQARAAAAVLKVTHEDIARGAAVARNTVLSVLRGDSVRTRSLVAIRRYFEGQGLAFDPDGLGLSWRRLRR